MVFCILVVCSCKQTTQFFNSEEKSFSFAPAKSTRYTEGFYDITLVKKGSYFASYSISEIKYTKTDLSTMVRVYDPNFSMDDSLSVLDRDGNEIGRYMVSFSGDENELGFTMVDGQFKKTVSTARVIIPYRIQAKYIKIGSKKIKLLEDEEEEEKDNAN